MFVLFLFLRKVDVNHEEEAEELVHFILHTCQMYIQGEDRLFASGSSNWFVSVECTPISNDCTPK